MCLKICELVIAAVILVFSFWNTTYSGWIIIIAAIILAIHSLMCCKWCCCCGSCEMPEKAKPKKKK